MNTSDAQVIIAGGGPTGMTLALELASHGIRSIVAERNLTTTTHPKMDLTNGRSMELFRRLGIADTLRAVGVPSTEPLDIVWATSATGHVLHRFAYPSPDARREMTRVENNGTGTIEPSMRVSQVILEPVLKGLIDESPFVDVRFGWAYEGHDQCDEGVRVRLKDSNGQTTTVQAPYLVGCDGGGSRVRKDLGIELEGQHAVANAFMVHFRSTDADAVARFGIAYHLQTARGTLISQNGGDIFTLQAAGVDPDSDPDALLRAFVGKSFEYEILVANPWTPHLVVAERYRQGRVFLVGDAAHQFIPTGGYGMNTGVGDAVDLGWKLGAVLNGWGGDALLDSYQVERRSVGLQNQGASLRHAMIRGEITERINNAIAIGALEGESAADARLILGEQIKDLGNAENESWGIEHGYRYDHSPVICSEDSVPPFDPLYVQVNTVPGARLPHIFLSDGSALFDLLGHDLTLLVIGEADLGNFAQCAGSTPVKVVRLEREAILSKLERRLLLIRPDQHVAWRADAAPDDWAPVLARVCGRV